jgi:glycosyltransferase involved in cell wall biosynthesis
MLKDGLSVIMIGRDEERMLPRTLPPLRSVADEIVFVDTGSQDGTLDIVQSFQCRVFNLPWQDDFSQARNFAIEQAACRWVLSVDCDEELSMEGNVSAALQRCCRGMRDYAFLVAIDNLQADGGVTRHEALRLFRNDPRIRFSNPIHESVSESVYQAWPGQRPKKAGIRLLHYGYADQHNGLKLERNMRILRQWVAREPENVYACYKLGMNLQFRGDPDGMMLLERTFRLLDGRADRQTYPFLANLVSLYLEGLEREGNAAQADAVRKRVRAWHCFG